jgi:hypothetical protein
MQVDPRDPRFMLTLHHTASVSSPYTDESSRGTIYYDPFTARKSRMTEYVHTVDPIVPSDGKMHIVAVFAGNVVAHVSVNAVSIYFYAFFLNIIICLKGASISRAHYTFWFIK